MSESEFVRALYRLADELDATDPAWAQDLRDDPAVYAPHPTYGDRPDCCRYPFDHPIHAPMNVLLPDMVRERIRANREP